ncbi:MAG: ABC transporter ATP-binding protein [Bacteroidetes bacterium]|nr:MAG: ABC transporter ATP-binding protein [Bacteroidota bacterium]TAG89647.1 MAG: ABC transporter ATP-binding protein [Bacteroidota bacterium]
MLSIQNLSFYFGGRAIYENASLHIKPKNRIALIGANGTGKSTLLRLIVGEYTPDEGSISRAKECTIGFLNQDLLSYQSENSIKEVALEAFEEANKIQKEINEILLQLETDYSDKLIEKLTDLQTHFEALDGYTIESKTEEILEGLGFSTADLSKPLQKFSGGWRMRVMLAKLLLQKPALLLLDEPTNHLDLPSIEWLEQYLSNYEGAIVAVSHDRDFLANIADTVVEVTQRNLEYYGGDYVYYIEEKALRKQIQQSSYENQQQKIKQTERFIERFKAKASKARQVQSRVKMLDRMDMLEDVIDENAKVNFRFQFGQASGKVVLQLDEISKSYGDLNILKKTTATIEKGDKIALIGANGKGKSTLLRILEGREQIDGKREEGYNLQTAFYAQHQLESLNVNNNLIDELKMEGSQKSEAELRNVLGCFLFGGDDVFKKIKVLSGGEKSRVALAKVLISEANFLLLDEPTNHLDIQSVNILIQALQKYEGSYVIVSHDRHFVSETANKIWYIEDKEIKEYPGTYYEFVDWRERKAEENKNNPTPVVVEKNAKPIVTKERNDTESKKNKKELQNVENQITELENQQKNIEMQLADSNIYTDKQKSSQLQKELKNVQAKLETLLQEWEVLSN